LSGNLVLHYVATWYEIDRQLSTFSFERAECFSEDDRATLKKLIAAWYGTQTEDGQVADDGIEVFNVSVRTEVRQHFARQAGPRRMVRYKIFLPLAILCFIGTLDVLLARLDVPPEHFRGASGKALDLLGFLLHLGIAAFATTPCFTAIIVYVCTRLPTQGSHFQKLLASFGTCLAGFPAILPYILSHACYTYLPHGLNIMAEVLVSLCICLFVFQADAHTLWLKAQCKLRKRGATNPGIHH